MQAVALAAHAALRARCALQGPEREQQLSNMTAQDGIADLLCVMLQQAELRPLLLARGIEADILALVPDMLVRLVCRTLQFGAVGTGMARLVPICGSRFAVCLLRACTCSNISSSRPTESDCPLHAMRWLLLALLVVCRPGARRATPWHWIT